ncbi:N-acetylmannosaminyltransferase [Gracilibacillus boraciitolerans JCM 21714]|uniref:N-acetylglucosaminyldiphosphoundecaprenol N-acetyl-beta-D-mannosaminyltransferase n=1 Tax=Gracilibacillus boraciitolerans JCM 21714 TaxID=1298598 RepID=W4VPR7_9BACI|nr:WecB/TagA/CpsF family glycosyltransferase [Gracilibacillus boraciitolerans]GAE95166.1 N-acetylmannosaminyltransferase [Gracilibacillus boraciitolerans JCM 21714]
MKTITILDIPFINTTQREFIIILDQHIKNKEKSFVITANPEIVMKAEDDPPSFKSYINKADYVTADGIGIILASRMLKTALPERVTGFDSMLKLLEIANEKQYKIFLLGAHPDTLKVTVEKVATNYPDIQLVGYHDGYFDWDQNDIIEQIRATQPDITFVALGVPRQEKWIAEHINQFSHGIFIGVGGSFDVIAGTVKRAPKIWRKLNLEWLYRLIKQPSRWRRMLALPLFALKIAKIKMFGTRK